MLVLNDPARGIDIGAKFDLYRNLREFAARGAAVVFLSSEVEEFLNLCTRVHVFRNGAIAFSFEPPYDSHALLNAMFGRSRARRSAARPTIAPRRVAPARQQTKKRGMPDSECRSTLPHSRERSRTELPLFFAAPDIPPGSIIPGRFVEDSLISPRLAWSGVPEGTRSFAFVITDPDLPAEFNFPRSFAHWLVFDIPADGAELPEGASRSASCRPGAQNSTAIS